MMRQINRPSVLKYDCREIFSVAAVVSLVFLTAPVAGIEASSESVNTLHDNDPHYTPAGFFDIHVCNWPNRELFFMPLFSTTRYQEITSVTISQPDGSTLTTLDTDTFKLIKAKGKPEKRVFITQIDVPEEAKDGWYSATINLVDGSQLIAKDYVIVSRLARPSNMNPPDGAEQIPIPEKLTWSALGQGYYQVFIRDSWDNNKLIYKSKLLNKPELTLPSDLLEVDGLYTWQIHARDVNEDVLLGDFNKGSMSHIAKFSTSSNQ